MLNSYTQLIGFLSVQKDSKKPADPLKVEVQYCSRSIHLATASFISSLNKIVMHRASSPKCTLRIEPFSRFGAAVVVPVLLLHLSVLTRIVFLNPKAPQLLLGPSYGYQYPLAPPSLLLLPILNFTLKPLPLRPQCWEISPASTEVDKLQSIPDISSPPGSGDLAVWHPRQLQ